MSEEPPRLVGPDSHSEATAPPGASDPAYIEELNGINAVCASIISELNKVDVDLLPVDPFGRRSFTETNTALNSVYAIVRAKWYLDYTFHEGESAKNKAEEYARTVAQKWNSREAAEELGSEEQTAAVTTRFDKLEEFILQQRADDPEARMQSEEKIRAFKRLAANGAANVHKSSVALRGIVDDLNHVWLYMDATNLRALRRHERRRSRHRLFHAGRLIAYAILVVVIGVFVGDGLNRTKFASLWAALIVAIVLLGIDRWLISPRLERWSRIQELQELKGDVTTRAENLGSIRLQQSSIDIVADDVGVPRVELLSSQLMRLPVARSTLDTGR